MVRNAARDVVLPVASQPSIDHLFEYAAAADDGGYDRVWTPETSGRDAVTTLGVIADRTDDLGIGTGIASVFSRSPALLGQTAATLQEASGGQFRLGLGQSAPTFNEMWHGVEHERPFRRLRESIEIVRRVLSGEVVDYDGDIFELSGFQLRFEPQNPPPPIDVSAIGPKSMELAGRFADGCITLMATPDGLRDRRDSLSAGAELGGRDPDNIRMTLNLPCCALEDGDRARELVCHHIAYYIGGMQDVYRDHLARQGYPDEAEEIQRLWADGDHEEAMAIVSDDLLDELGVAGTPGTAREQLERWESLDVLDVATVMFPVRADPEDILATIEALAPNP